MPENTDSTPKNADLEEVAKLLDVQYQPPLDAGSVQSLDKSLPGYQAIADDTARRVREFANAYPEIAKESKFPPDFMKAFRPKPKRDMSALRARIQTGCSLRGRRFFRNFCFSETLNDFPGMETSI